MLRRPRGVRRRWAAPAQGPLAAGAAVSSLAPGGEPLPRPGGRAPSWPHSGLAPPRRPSLASVGGQAWLPFAPHLPKAGPQPVLPAINLPTHPQWDLNENSQDSRDWRGFQLAPSDHWPLVLLPLWGPPGPPIRMVTQALEPGHTLRALLPGRWRPRVRQSCRASGILSLGPQRPAYWAGCESLELAGSLLRRPLMLGTLVPSFPSTPNFRMSEMGSALRLLRGDGPGLGWALSLAAGVSVRGGGHTDAEGGRPSEAGGRARVTWPPSSEAWAWELGEREEPCPKTAGARSTP